MQTPFAGNRKVATSASDPVRWKLRLAVARGLSGTSRDLPFVRFIREHLVITEPKACQSRRFALS